jgi:hypothetical protein
VTLPPGETPSLHQGGRLLSRIIGAAQRFEIVDPGVFPFVTDKGRLKLEQ